MKLIVVTPPKFFIEEDKIITGIGMESNQRLTKYRVLKPQGIIPLDEDEETE